MPSQQSTQPPNCGGVAENKPKFDLLFAYLHSLAYHRYLGTQKIVNFMRKGQKHLAKLEKQAQEETCTCGDASQIEEYVYLVKDLWALQIDYNYYISQSPNFGKVVHPGRVLTIQHTNLLNCVGIVLKVRPTASVPSKQVEALYRGINQEAVWVGDFKHIVTVFVLCENEKRIKQLGSLVTHSGGILCEMKFSPPTPLLFCFFSLLFCPYLLSH
jgi:hypothetical protein